MRKIIVFFIILAAATLGVNFFWSSKKDEKPQGEAPKMKVVAFTVEPSQLTVNLDTVGTLNAVESTTIRTEVSGKVEAMPLIEGQAVQKGDLLLQINDQDYQQEVERKRAALDLAELTYKRQEELVKAGATTQQIKDESYSTMMIQKAEYETAKIQLERTKIYAPYDGILGVTDVSLGEYLVVGAPIIQISAINPMIAQFPISQNYISKIKLNEPMTVTVDSWPNEKFEGYIYAIDPQIDIETRTITVKADVKNDELLLRPGMFAYISLPIEVKENSLLIPEEALIPSADKLDVMKIVDGVAQLVKVTIGVRQNALVEVTNGLQKGDVIIRSGQLKVQEGTAVEISSNTSIEKNPNASEETDSNASELHSDENSST